MVIGMAEWRLSVRHDDGENEQEDNVEEKEDERWRLSEGVLYPSQVMRKLI